MKFSKFSNIIKVGAFSAAIALGVSGTAAFADTMTVSYLAPGVESQVGAAYHMEDFNSGFTGTTTYGGSGITGTYSQTPGFTLGGTVIPADQYGGAGGSGSYIVALGLTAPASYTVNLSTPVNYFGYWLSAQDPGDTLKIYSGATLLYTFTAADLTVGINGCSVAVHGPYCGNPDAPFLGANNTSSNYAFVNFYDNGGTFDKLVFTEVNTGNGYESDNHTVANLLAPPPGTTLGTPTTIPHVSSVPEPSSLALLGTGVLGIAASMRRKLFKK